MIIRKANLDDIEKVYNLLCELENRKLPVNEFKGVFAENLKNPPISYFVC